MTVYVPSYHYQQDLFIEIYGSALPMPLFRQVESHDTTSTVISEARWYSLTYREKVLIALTVISALLFGGLLGGLISVIIHHHPCKGVVNKPYQSNVSFPNA